ncbi:MAG: HIT domain-containing protein [Idiomarina sp.]|nr:HIT domain-containing protein [Idiomarina sp.]
MIDHDWTLHEQLAADTWHAGDLPLCRVLVMNDQQYPWVVLVPRVAGVREIYELDAMLQQQLNQESSRTAMWMMRHFAGDKFNVAALGNMVPQLHLHHVVRFEGDPAWPAPIWGKLPMKGYSAEAAEDLIQALREGLGLR